VPGVRAHTRGDLPRGTVKAGTAGAVSSLETCRPTSSVSRSESDDASREAGVPRRTLVRGLLRAGGRSTRDHRRARRSLGVESRTRIARAHPFKHPSHIDFSPDGSKLAVKNTSGEIVVLDGSTLDVLARHSGRPWGEGAEVLFSPCGEYLVDGTWSGALVVREALTGTVVHREEDEGRSIGALDCTRDRLRWAYNVWRHAPHKDVWLTIRSWPFTAGRSETRFQATAREARSIHALALDPSGASLAVTGHGLQLWGVSTDEPELLRKAPVLPVSGTGRAVAWSPSGEMLALAGAGETRLFTNALREIWRTDLEYSCDVAFSPSGDLLAFGAWSRGFVIATPVPSAT
jgi:WD40 repeat protein